MASTILTHRECGRFKTFVSRAIPLKANRTTSLWGRNWQMKILPTLYWNEKIVMGYLIQAASIHRRQPEPRVAGYHTLWPPMLRDDWERLYDIIHGPFRMGPPMPAEVTYSERVMEWLGLFDRSRQQIIWMRANRIPWKILVDEFDRSKVSLWRDLSESLSVIKYHLNRIDPKGDDFKALRSRAWSVSTP
ncbi:hypothetical protein JIN85_15250 [Luteolibacter pohnpeiensis]|uniref:DUF6362 domain-containing protein n=1 Tax=Luteolibacter pohnpeiensis TaxID=454153 RepID=A0A934VXR9_9BACT|nr:DUF6362 family protein [Luteolibacter pohnpeiensis]MBK1883774.1 hypothetical protein [Luteolibacter pohnpeiensis]